MKILSITYLLITAFFTIAQAKEKLPETISLNGTWYMGYNQQYNQEVYVPGIHNDPGIIPDKTLWYKKQISLPKGAWNRVTLELKGARFKPEVFIDGTSIGSQEGGMAPLFFPLNHENIKPGGDITLEIALLSLQDVPESDASYIPVADQWRSNVSSCLWDDVVLHFHKDVRIERIIPFIDYDKQNAEIKFELNSQKSISGLAKVDVLGKDGNLLLTSKKYVKGEINSVSFEYKNKLNSWSPDEPNVYNLRLSIFDENDELLDVSEMAFGIKSFEVQNKKFLLNEQPFTARGVTVVWPRWMRTDEGRELGYDVDWFYSNIIKRTKELGGNYLRFHLGLPPERFLDLCDEHGLIVQYEWSFFHGMPASKESLLLQYKSWLDLAMRHPSVALIHPYNETHGDELETAWAALNELFKDYPSMVLEERDVIHVHKYWWSLFENLGLYYNSFDDFPKAIMVDEFGGNYLDGDGNFGGYPKVKEAFLRFLGRTHTVKERLDFQAQANVKVAEYWRRIGAAGVSPFCALGSHEDGSHWFMGSLKEGNPKPVWDALTPVFSPRAVSLEIWDRNYAPNQIIELPVYLFNDEADNSDFNVKIIIQDKEGNITIEKVINTPVKGFSTVIKKIGLKIPSTTGQYTIEATLLNPPAEVKYPVYSAWGINVIKARVPENIASAKIGVPKDEPELRAFLKEFNLDFTGAEDPEAEVIITSLNTWTKIESNDTEIKQMLSTVIDNGKSVVMLDVGDRFLGKGYPKEDRITLGNLQGQEKLTETRSSKHELFAGVSLGFTEVVESESHIHPAKENKALWKYLSKDAAWLWNGYRGGLIVPASDMEVSGLNSKAFIEQWEEKGADKTQIISKAYYAYELDGYYEFSNKKNDPEIKARLRDKVRFLMEDAPALAISLDPEGPIESRNLNTEFKLAEKGKAEKFVPLAECGKGLTRTPIAMIQFGNGKGQLVVSQLLTNGRLANGFGKDGLYGIRADEAARQFVLNSLSFSLKGD